MSSKYYLFLFCACSIGFEARQTCPFRASGETKALTEFIKQLSWILLHACIGNITNGITTELIRTDTGLLLGIRVSWSWLADDPTECFQSPRVELSTNTGPLSKTLSSTSRNNSVEFLNLDCNQMYTPRVRATFGGQTPLFENGNPLFFGGTYLCSQHALI